jgi:zinc transport system substrate-binding protein
VWLSLKNASSLTATISDAISEALPENAELINNNAKNYISKINALDKKAEDSIALAKVKTLLFADRFPFSYMAKDYSLECFAAFSGCSADSEATFETVTTLATKLDELSLSYVLVLESSDKKLAQTVGRENLVKIRFKAVKRISGGKIHLSVRKTFFHTYSSLFLS